MGTGLGIGKHLTPQTTTHTAGLQGGAASQAPSSPQEPLGAVSSGAISPVSSGAISVVERSATYLCPWGLRSLQALPQDRQCCWRSVRPFYDGPGAAR